MGSSSSRFRTGSVSAPATPAERLRRHLGDGERFIEVGTEQVTELAAQAQAEPLLELMAVAREHDDPHRVYLLHRIAATLLMAAAGTPGAGGEGEEYGWARYFDLATAVLVPQLEREPHEPELLNLLGLAYYELGDTPVARRLFDAVRRIEPEHLQARANLRACKERAARAGSLPKLADPLTKHARSLHGAAKRIADLAQKLPDRTVSLCMIVKDEEEMLPGCLDAVRDHVDEIIVVDTGSSDRTREIASERGAIVVDFPWTGSFSDARNRSVEDATGDWILYLDADEHMAEGDGRHLRELARKTWVEGFYLVENHFTGEFEMGGQTSHMAMRMFRNRPQYRWEGLIHEQKMRHFPVYLPERFQNSPVRIDHYGYLRRVVDDRGKRERNLELLLRQLPDQDDAFTNFNIGSEYGAMHDWVAARPYFERALELAREEQAWWQQQFAPMMVSRLVTSRRATGDDQGAVALIAEGLRHWPDFTDLVFERALIHGQRRDLDAAEADCRLCLELGDAPARYVAVQGKGSYQARALLADVLRSRGDLHGAARELETAFADAPKFLPLLLELADVRLKLGSADEVAADLEGRLGEAAEGPHASLLLATAFYEAGELGHADRYYRRVLERQPDNAAALIGLAELSLAEGRHDDALELVGRVPDDHPMVTRAARTRFLAAVVVGDHASLEASLRAITGAEHLPHGERAFYTAWHARVTGGHALLGPDPDAAVQCMENLEALAKLEAVEEFERLLPLLEQSLPDERERRMQLAALYLRRHFADLAGEELMVVAERFGADPQVLTGLGKVATMKEMWQDAEVFLVESLQLQPDQADARRLLELIRAHTG